MTSNPVPALRVTALQVRSFRNLSQVDVQPGARFNVIHGDNGAGKSSLLEALDYVATLESFRHATADELVMQGQEHATILAKVDSRPLPKQVKIAISRSAPRHVSVDGKKPRTTAAHRASMQSVVFHPADVELCGGAPERRRAFLDRIASHLDATYANALATYTKAIRSRNRLLKTDGVDRRSITAFDELLASAGSVIGQARAQLTEELGPQAEEAFREVFGTELPLDVRYVPRVAPDIHALRRALERSLDKDLARGFTAEGPHGDDVLFAVRGTKARHYASQGQQRAIVLALKVAELRVIARRTGLVPYLLLDDVSSELDRERNRRFFRVLATLGGQVFLTTTHREYALVDEERVDFRVENGAVAKV